MRSFYARGVALALSLASLANVALAQDAGIPSLLPLPSAVPAAYPVAQTAATDALWQEGDQSPVPPAPVVDALPAPGEQYSEKSVISPEYAEALNGGYGGYEGCDTCQNGCCPHNTYVYANALAMTREKRGGFVTSLDAATFEPELFFCGPNFGDLWYGGFEVGAGWCFGCDCRNALELNYWGLFPAEHTVESSGPLNSTIDFADLNYGAGTVNDIYNGAAAHRLQFNYSFDSVELNLIGNGCNGGPWGCGRCGCCTNDCGSRLSYGWLAGLRYISYDEDWAFSADFDDTIFDGDATQVNYDVDLNNNLFGFQLGTGLEYCLTNSLSVIATGRAGIYGNFIEQRQRIGGSAGPVTINNGPNLGEVFSVYSTDNDLAMVAQFDLGGRWAVSHHWSIDFGYRVLGISGVAIAEDNVQRTGFQNLEGISDIQTQGALLLHGGYVGATYCW